jgi:hypothetical protein
MLVRWVAVALMAVATGCGASSKSRSAKSGSDDANVGSLIDEKNESEDQEILARRQCLGDGHKPKECMSDDDCCQGFYCGLDPDVSTRIKVCVDSGQ